MKDWLRGIEFDAGAQTSLGWHLPPTRTKTRPPVVAHKVVQPQAPRPELRDAIIAAHKAHPNETNAQLARRVGASRSYVGKVLGPRKR